MNRLRKVVTPAARGTIFRVISTYSPQLLTVLPFSFSEKPCKRLLSLLVSLTRHLLPFLVQKRVESPCWSLGNKRMVDLTGHL